MPDDHSIEVERIKADAQRDATRTAARQNIIVAVIAAIPTFLATSAGYWAISPSHEPAPIPEQRWLVIESASSETDAQFKVVAKVNGINYSYPADAPYATTGPEMAPQRQPLQITNEPYNVSFDFYLVNGGVSEHGTSREVHQLPQADIPLKESREYKMFLVRDNVKLPDVAMRVKYTIE